MNGTINEHVAFIIIIIHMLRGLESKKKKENKEKETCVRRSCGEKGSVELVDCICCIKLHRALVMAA